MDKPDLKALVINDEKWYEIDDQQDLNNAEALFAEGKEALSLYGKRYGGYWRFPMMLDFCYLVNPYFPTMRMKDEMRSNFDILLTEYPSGMQVNTQLAARYTDISPEQIIVGNGAAELINAYMHLSAERMTGVCLPTFEEYPNRLPKDKLVCFKPKNKDFSYTSSDLIAYFEHTPIEQLIIINPDNPSGNLLSKTELLTLLEWSKRKGIQLLIDESFLDFAREDDTYSLFNKELLSQNPHLVVIKSISKSFGVPGLRLGFLATGDLQLIQRLRKEISIWNINSFAEFYMQIFIKYREDYKKARIKFIEERKRFFQCLQHINYLRVIPSAANYFLCEVVGKYTTEDICSILLANHNILLKNCSTKAGFNQAQYIRMAIRNQKENDKLIAALASLND